MPTTLAAAAPLPAGSTVPHGWVLEQARANLAGVVGALPRLAVEVAGEVFAAGRVGPGTPVTARAAAAAAWWNGESEGSWLLGYAGHARMTRWADAVEDVERRLARALAHQDDDGYLGMFTAALRAQRPWIGGDLWTQSRLLLALEAWGQLTGERVWSRAVDRAVVALGQRVAAAGEAAFAVGTGDSSSRGHDLQMVDALLAVVRRTGDRGVVDLARDLYDRFSAAELDWTEQDCRLPALLGDAPFAGHGVHTCENLRVPLLLWEVTGEPRLLEAFERGWAKLAAAVGVAGAVRSDETIGSPGERPFPLPEAGCELCAMTELAVTALEAARVTGRTAYADAAERVFLNAAQAARAVDGGGVGYLTAENQVGATHAMGVRWAISPTHDAAAVCCVPNAGRILPEVVDRAVVRTPAGALVLVYGPLRSVVPHEAGTVVLTQRTAYPFEETVEVDVDGAPAGFTLELRIPGWCTTPQVSAPAALEVTHAVDRVLVRGAWPAAATVRLRLPHAVVPVPSVDGRVALTAGPLVYSWPVAVVEKVFRRYPGSDLVDRDLYPADEHALYPPVLLAERLGDARLVVAHPPGSDPWRDPPTRIVARGLDPNPRPTTHEGMGERDLVLVPLGATSLRWTCLPVVGTAPRADQATGSDSPSRSAR